MNEGKLRGAIDAHHSVASAPDCTPMPRLLILASLPALQNPEGQWLLPAKFVNGLCAYARRWSGPIVVGLQAGELPSADLDNRFWSEDELPFKIRTVSFTELADQGGELLNGSVVLAILNHMLYGLGQRCKEQAAQLVVNTELSLHTQLQIAKSTHGWGLQLIKTGIWLVLNHRKALKEIKLASGLQCNGTPTFDAFAQYNPSPLLYFDNRTTSDLCVSAAELDERFELLSQRGRLRLLFSGRLHPIKGVSHLIPLACSLRDKGVPFELCIAGDGPLRASLQVQIEENELQEQVRLLGTLDFAHELMPMLRREIDLFVCPHLQGDPSCTYLETLCAGVPIVGYPNEAWRGLHRLSSAGHLCVSFDPKAMATEIETLSADLAGLRKLAELAQAFGRQHLFDAEFDRRISHLQELCKTAGAQP